MYPACIKKEKKGLSLGIFSNILHLLSIIFETMKMTSFYMYFYDVNA